MQRLCTCTQIVPVHHKQTIRGMWKGFATSGQGGECGECVIVQRYTTSKQACRSESTSTQLKLPSQQGLALVHLPAQPEPFLIQQHTLHTPACPLIPPDTP
jgi:hypothetical protein